MVSGEGEKALLTDFVVDIYAETGRNAGWRICSAVKFLIFGSQSIF